MTVFDIKFPQKKNNIEAVIGGKIKEARGYCDITVEQLAALADKPIQYIKSVEAGKEDIGFNELVKFADALDVSTDFLLGRDMDDGYAKDIEYDNMFTREALDLISGCSSSERYHLLEVATRTISGYKQFARTGFSMQYEPEKANDEVEESMRIITYKLRYLSNREQSVVLGCMKLALAQMRAKIEVLFIPFPSCEVDRNLLTFSNDLADYKSGNSRLFQ